MKAKYVCTKKLNTLQQRINRRKTYVGQSKKTKN